MSTNIPPISIKRYADGFCSQDRSILPPVRTIEDCVQIIEQILEKNVICKHDIDDIDRLYATIDRLEKQVVSTLPENSSHFILQKIIQKLDKAVRLKLITPEGWIRLYHLQNFSDKQLQLKKHFTVLSKGVPKKPEDLREIATHLPYCMSKAQFDNDVQVLIGDNPSPEVSEILDRKREKLDNYEILKTDISDRKKKLDALRQGNPNNYPLFLDELLEHGYIHLYDHLLEMRALPTRNDRHAKIETLSFSSLSHIVLEAREAIIQKVKDAMRTGSKNVLFLLGGTGAGKSTTLCCLRGDTMVLKGFQYESTNDHNQLIGTSAVTSCTFLPTVEIVNDLVIIDFPGFDDTNGPLISLGMECALKALIKEFKAKVLVLEAVTNIEGKFAAAAQLGARLKRLFENTKDCFLGITKYSKDPDCGQIRKIEEDQKNELIKPSSQEMTLEGKIQALSGLDMSTLHPANQTQIQTQIQSLKDQLSQLKQEKIHKQQLPLPDTDLKKQSREELHKREDELLKQIGLGKMIRFWNLENPKHVSSCLEMLTDPKDEVIRVKPQPKDPITDPILDAHDKALIQLRFENHLKREIENREDYYIECTDVKLFMQHVLESSLIDTIFSETHPEIGQFLHLPEIDSTLVNDFDKGIVSSCIEKIMKSIISNLDISLTDSLLKQKIKALKTKLEMLDNLAKRLRDYVFGLLGVRLENPGQAEKKWEDLRDTYIPQFKAEDEKWKLPTWAQILMGIPVGIPLVIYKLLKEDAKSKVEQKAVGELIDKACQELEQIYNALGKLKDLEKIIDKRKELDEAFHSIKLSINSETDLIESIRNKINKIRNIYGSADWDKRIETLKDSSSYIHLIKKDGSDNYFLIYIISSLIDKETKLENSVAIMQKVTAENLEDQHWLLFRIDITMSSRRATIFRAINETTDVSHHVFRTMVAAVLFSIYENTQPSSTAAVQTQVINSKS